MFYHDNHKMNKCNETEQTKEYDENLKTFIVSQVKTIISKAAQN